jgi:hypothetical protein
MWTPFTEAHGVRFLGITTLAVNPLGVSEELSQIEEYMLVALEPTSPFITRQLR